MPTYDYRCTKCGHRFELFHGIKDEAPKRCPRCKSKAVRVPVRGAGLLFKGSGFYITDYRSESYKEKAKSDAGASGTGVGDGDGGSGAAKGEKSEMKSEKKGEKKGEKREKREQKGKKEKKKGGEG